MAAHNAGNGRQQREVSFGRNIDPLMTYAPQMTMFAALESDIDQLHMFRYLTEA